MLLARLTIGALIAGTLAAPAHAQDPTARVNPYDRVEKCFNVVPAATPVATIGATQIDLRVLVLLDGVPEDEARAVFQKVAGVYAPLNIRVTAGYRAVQMAPADDSGFIAQAKQAVGGGRP